MTPPRFDLPRRLLAEALGTAFLLATVVGSGIMAERLADGNVALALLANAISTGAILIVLITILGPVSGAHLNPAVSAALALRRELPRHEFIVYVLAQLAGGVAGSALAHGMFELPLVQISVTTRTGAGQWLGESTAAFGLLFTIFGCMRFRPAAVPWCVGLYITAAYWFTSSTSFANPTVTIARGLSDTLAGIRPADVPAFIVAQLAGALAASLLAGWLFAEPKKEQRCAIVTSSGPAALHASTQPAAQADVADDDAARGPLGAQPETPASLSRLAVRRHDPRQEPGAVVPLAGICAGGGEQSPSLPRRPVFTD